MCLTAGKRGGEWEASLVKSVSIYAKPTLLPPVASSLRQSLGFKQCRGPSAASDWPALIDHAAKMERSENGSPDNDTYIPKDLISLNSACFHPWLGLVWQTYRRIRPFPLPMHRRGSPGALRLQHKRGPAPSWTQRQDWKMGEIFHR